MEEIIMLGMVLVFILIIIIIWIKEDKNYHKEMEKRDSEFDQHKLWLERQKKRHDRMVLEGYAYYEDDIYNYNDKEIKEYKFIIQKNLPRFESSKKIKVLVGLHLEDIDFEINMINVKRAVVWDKGNQRILEKATKTKGSVREVPVPLFCMEVIKEYLKLRERIIYNFKRRNRNYIPPRNLFLSKTGAIMFPDTPSGKWLDFRKRNPQIKDVSLHGLRHSYCSM